MADDELVECPVCDRPIDPDATSCPACGADFTIQGIDELEGLSKNLDPYEGDIEPAPMASIEEALPPLEVSSERYSAEPVEAPQAASVAVTAQPAEVERREPKKKLFSRLFGRSER